MPTIWCAIRTYSAHAEEMGVEVPTKPEYFLKPAAALLSSTVDNVQTILIPDDRSIQHELELVLRIGDISEKGDITIDAVCIGLDLTNRVIQSELKKNGLPWARCKSFKNSAVIGDWCEIPAQRFSEVEDDWSMVLLVNSQQRMGAKISEMVRSPSVLTAALGEWAPLEKGDLIFTGTPEGVDWLCDGDIVEAHLLDGDGIAKSRLIANFERPSDLK